MICKVCRREIEKHDIDDIVHCLRNGFEIGLDEVHDTLVGYNLVVGVTQPKEDKRFAIIGLKNGTTIRTYNLTRAYAEILLTRCDADQRVQVAPAVALVEEVEQEELPVVEPEPEVKKNLEDSEDLDYN